jgi:segregation and condensation protein A
MTEGLIEEGDSVVAQGDFEASGGEVIENSNANVTRTDSQMLGQEQLHSLLFGEQLSWQAIMYDLINSEQLDPWDVDLGLLASKFLEKVRELEEASFFVSSKVLLAASLLLRMKSEILLERDIKDLDDVLFGKKKEYVHKQERLELDEDIPDLVVRTPLPRFKKVTLKELISALDTAIKTENRRIRKISLEKQHDYETALSLPKRKINLHESIKGVYGKIEKAFESENARVAFSDLLKKDGSKEDLIATFMPILHLDNQQKLWVEQDAHFDEIWIWLKDAYMEKHRDELEILRKDVEEEMKEFEAQEAIDHESGFESEVAEGINSGLEEKEE